MVKQYPIFTDYSNDGGSIVLNAFYNRMQIGDIVLSCYSSKTIDAIGVVTGEPEWHDEYQHYKRLRNVKWLAKGINEDIIDLNAGKSMTLSSVYKLSVSVSDALDVLRKVKPSLFTQKVKIPNRVFIIDEINRGIFLRFSVS
jgi:5-methylcytosine-specific restriction protein B